MYHFIHATLVLEDRLLQDAELLILGDRIHSLGKMGTIPHHPAEETIDLHGAMLAPGYIDLHVHGGAGADFMDGTAWAFETVCRCHAAHGTTSLTPTSTVARQDQMMQFLKMGAEWKKSSKPGSRVLGTHIYGPYFAKEARGCHPGASLRPPTPEDYQPYFDLAGSICTATVAPELPGAEDFVKACRSRGIRCNAGHTYATFEQMDRAIGWGIRHVDHLFCAMSDRAKLRLAQSYPMRGGVLEATLFFDELTTEVIADGKHLQAELLRLAYKLKGPDRLALVTDANRAVDMPDGEYLFGPVDGGEKILRHDGVGVMPDGKALASGVMGMDHMVRTFHRLTHVPIYETIRMASLTPARILGLEAEMGSIALGKKADLIVLDEQLHVKRVFINGQKFQ